MSIYRRALAYYRPFLWPTVGAVLLTLVAIGLGLLRGWPFAFIVGKLLPAAATGERLAVLGRDFGDWSLPSVVGLMCALIVAFHLISGLLNLFTGIIFLRVGLHALLRLRTELYACLHSLPLKYHDQRRSADSSFRVAYDSQSIQAFYSKAIFIFQSSFLIELSPSCAAVSTALSRSAIVVASVRMRFA